MQPSDRLAGIQCRHSMTSRNAHHRSAASSSGPSLSGSIAPRLSAAAKIPCGVPSQFPRDSAPQRAAATITVHIRVGLSVEPRPEALGIVSRLLALAFPPDPLLRTRGRFSLVLGVEEARFDLGFDIFRDAPEIRDVASLEEKVDEDREAHFGQHPDRHLGAVTFGPVHRSSGLPRRVRVCQPTLLMVVSMELNGCSLHLTATLTWSTVNLCRQAAQRLLRYRSAARLSSGALSSVNSIHPARFSSTFAVAPARGRAPCSVAETNTMVQLQSKNVKLRHRCMTVGEDDAEDPTEKRRRTASAHAWSRSLKPEGIEADSLGPHFRRGISKGHPGYICRNRPRMRRYPHVIHCYRLVHLPGKQRLQWLRTLMLSARE